MKRFQRLQSRDVCCRFAASLGRGHRDWNLALHRSLTKFLEVLCVWFCYIKIQNWTSTIQYVQFAVAQARDLPEPLPVLQILGYLLLAAVSWTQERLARQESCSVRARESCHSLPLALLNEQPPPKAACITPVVPYSQCFLQPLCLSTFKSLSRVSWSLRVIILE